MAGHKYKEMKCRDFRRFFTPIFMLFDIDACWERMSLQPIEDHFTRTVSFVLKPPILCK